MNALGHASTLISVSPTRVPRDVAKAIGAPAHDSTRSLIEPLYHAITAAAHPDCPACAALLPVLSAFLDGQVSPPA